ncbi:MAG TPA: MlaD family protein [Candidatus Acidoferrales bacterium]|nr:MlaD family protein [Candidatus Acidoferrales bacterium]
MPSQKQLHWAQLRVGVTVVVACVALSVLIFLMSGTGGFLTKKNTYHAYWDSAGGLRVGAPVRVNAVDAGNVTGIRLVNHGRTPVEVTFRVVDRVVPWIRTDSVAQISQAGALGDYYIDIISANSTGPVAPNGAELPVRDVPDLMNVVRSSQSTLQNVDTLVARANRIFAAVENQEGSVGQLIYDDQLYRRLNSSVNDVQSMLNDINSGKGSIGMLLKDDTLYYRANDAVNKLNSIATDIDSGKGTLGKFVKDPSVYDNANQTLKKTNDLLESINRGEGALGKMAKDPAFAKKLDDIANNLQAITNKLNAGQGTAGKFLTDETLYNNTNNFMSESSQLITAIRQNPKKYLTVHVKIF